MNILKKEAIIYEVRNGELKKIKIDDTIYRIEAVLPDDAEDKEKHKEISSMASNIIKNVINTEEKNNEEKSEDKKKFRDAPKDAVGYDDVYKTWIKSDNVQKVKQAINHYGYGYIPNSKNISSQSKLGIQKVRATLHWLKDQGKIEEERYGDKYPKLKYVWVE